MTYLPRSGARAEAVLQLDDTPESSDPRGRTQRYQSLDKRRRRPAQQPSDGQMDLLDQLNLDGRDVGPGDNDDEQDSPGEPAGAAERGGGDEGPE